MNLVEARSSPALLARSIDPKYRTPPHVVYMSRAIRETVEGGGGRLMFFMPPRHGKSVTVSLWAALWFLERWPEKKVAITSYGREKATEWGREIRNTIEQNQDGLMLRLAPDSKAAHRWNTPEGGGLMCVGVGGGLTGFGAHLLICDDPVKDAKEAESATSRESTWQWWTKVALTRLAPGATVCLVMTRWHEDDLAGRVLRQEQELAEQGLPHHEWRVISFPCIAEDHDELGRSPGEPLWPSWGYDLEWSEKTKHEIGARAWASLYQQRPTPAGGLVFQREHFRYYHQDGNFFYLHQASGIPKRVPVHHVATILTCDTAMTEKTTSDYTVVCVLSVTVEGDIIVRQIKRGRPLVPDQYGYVMEERDKWVRTGTYRWTGIEDKGSGIGLLQLCKRRGVAVRELKAVVDKVTRASEAAVCCEQGRVYMPESAPWLADFETELLSFPNGLHDDQVDAFAYGCREVTLKPREFIATAYEDPDDDDAATGYSLERDYMPAGGGLDGYG